MHGLKSANTLSTAFISPTAGNPTYARPSPQNAARTPALALSNPLLSKHTPLSISNKGLNDPRNTLHTPPNLLSLRAHCDQTPEGLNVDEKDAAPERINTEKKDGDGNSNAPSSDKSAPNTPPQNGLPSVNEDGNDDHKKDFKNPLPGVEIGIPLNILASFFSNLRYGENVLNINDAVLQACLGYLTYGTDRLLDAYTETGKVSEKKQALYDDIKKNTLPMIGAIAASSAHAFNTLNERPETRPFIPLLASTFFYKELKEHCGPIKPFYIAAMWTAASVILPAVMHDHDFSILASPQDYLPAALLMFGSTNLADTKDIAEDTAKGIETLPVKLGRPVADVVSYTALATAALMIGSQLFGA